MQRLKNHLSVAYKQRKNILVKKVANLFYLLYILFGHFRLFQIFHTSSIAWFIVALSEKKSWFSFGVFSYKPGSEQTGFCAPSLLRVTSFRFCSPIMHCSRWFMLSKRLLWSWRYFSLYSAPWRYKRPESTEQWVNTQLSSCDLHYRS